MKMRLDFTADNDERIPHKIEGTRKLQPLILLIMATDPEMNWKPRDILKLLQADKKQNILTNHELVTVCMAEMAAKELLKFVMIPVNLDGQIFDIKSYKITDTGIAQAELFSQKNALANEAPGLNLPS